MNLKATVKQIGQVVVQRDLQSQVKDGDFYGTKVLSTVFFNKSYTEWNEGPTKSLVARPRSGRDYRPDGRMSGHGLNIWQHSSLGKTSLGKGLVFVRMEQKFWVP